MSLFHQEPYGPQILLQVSPEVTLSTKTYFQMKVSHSWVSITPSLSSQHLHFYSFTQGQPEITLIIHYL